MLLKSALWNAGGWAIIHTTNLMKTDDFENERLSTPFIFSYPEVSSIIHGLAGIYNNFGHKCPKVCCRLPE